MTDSTHSPNGKVLVRIGHDDHLSRRAHALLLALGLNEAASRVHVTWNKKLRTTAGRAYSARGRIELNPRLQLLAAEKKEAEIEQTFLHELAHLVAHWRYPGRRLQPHGEEWKRACADLGIPGEERCHDLNLGGRTSMRKNFAYICPACEVVIFRVRRIRRTVACYSCCNNHNGGKFHRRYQLVEKRLK